MFLGLSLENPSTGENTTVDAKIDTGAVVTLIPMHAVSDLGLEVIGETDLAMANGDMLHAYISVVTASWTGNDKFEIPIYICKSKNDFALIGMDILKHCNYAQWHEWKEGEHSLYFEIELAETPEIN